MVELFETICVVGTALGLAGICTEILMGSRQTRKHTAATDQRQEISLIERGYSGKTSLAAAIQASRQARTQVRAN